MVYILKGWVKFEYKGEGTFVLKKGDVVYQPPEIHHREIEHSSEARVNTLATASNVKRAQYSNSKVSRVA